MCCCVEEEGGGKVKRKDGWRCYKKTPGQESWLSLRWPESLLSRRDRYWISQALLLGRNERGEGEGKGKEQDWEACNIESKKCSKPCRKYCRTRSFKPRVWPMPGKKVWGPQIRWSEVHARNRETGQAL